MSETSEPQPEPQPEPRSEPQPTALQVIDSHTGGEPTRLVLSGFPDLGAGPMSERLALLKSRHDNLRSAVVNEPRGSGVLVGALLCRPVDPSCAAGVIFFNDVGYLGMCGHGTIGLIASLAHLGTLRAGRHRVETPVGTVDCELHAEDGSVSVHNVPAYRHATGVKVVVPDPQGEPREVSGDVAWGGNWFFLSQDHGLSVDTSNLSELTAQALAIREALAAAGLTGAGGAYVDHIELFAPSQKADSRSFVLCPGTAYDRSPCGTGTSAKLACLAADGKLAPGAVWRQESVIGSVFEAHYSLSEEGAVLPVIRGHAHVTAEAKLILDPADPFRWGIV